MNKKGSMDVEDFLKCLNNLLVPLYPDVKDIAGKRVVLKLDSVTGHLNSNLIDCARNLGFIIYPSVPITTAVTQ